ncbi:pregnancy-specific beta-1-glycoprotein 4 isoform 3 precursor, partial [Daubentonia madagascariensis]
WTRS